MQKEWKQFIQKINNDIHWSAKISRHFCIVSTWTHIAVYFIALLILSVSWTGIVFLVASFFFMYMKVLNTQDHDKYCADLLKLRDEAYEAMKKYEKF